MEAFSFFNYYILGFIALISILVFVHELGHYLVARWMGVKVEAFSIGFGKEIWGWTDKHGTRWKIAPIPLGGYVKMKGELLQGSESKITPDEDALESKTLLQKSLIVIAGPVFNLIFPIFMLVGIYFFSGVTYITSTIGEIVDNSPAANVLQVGDTITSINGSEVNSFAEIQYHVLINPNEEVSVTYLREGQENTNNIHLSSVEVDGGSIGYLGIGADANNIHSVKYSLSAAVSESYSTYVRIVNLILDALYKLFTGALGLDDLGSPIKIAKYSGESLEQGVNSWLFFMTVISINLAIMNLLPIPALDGGHLLIYAIQFITRNRLSVKAQVAITNVGVFMLLSLMIFMILNDILFFF